MSEVMNVPELRFSEFKGSWVSKRLGDLAIIQRGKFSPRPRNNPIYYGGQYPFVQTGDVFNSKGRIQKYTQTLNEEGLKVSRLFPEGTILITIAANIGYSGVLQMDCACPDSLIGISAKKDSVNYFLNYELTRQQPRMDYQADNNAQKNINLEFLKPYKLTVPSKEEQQKIADFLSSVDKKIEQLTEKHRLLTEYKKGVMQQIFTQQIRFKDDSGNDYPEWEKASVGELIDNRGGTALESLVSENGTHRFISIGNYSTDGKYVDNGQRISPVGKAKQKLLNKNDLVMVLNDKTASGDLIGSSILIDEDDAYIYNQRSERIICNGNFLSEFAWHLFNSKEFRKKVVSLSQGGTQIYINFSAIKSILIGLPEIEEQQKIANFLTEIDQKIDQAWSTLDQTKAFKKGLLQQMFV